VHGFPDGEVWIGPGELEGFVGEQQEDPDARADASAVEVENVVLEQRVQAAGQQAEGAGEEDGGDDGAVLELEAFQQRDEGDGVEGVVEEGPVEEGVGVETVYCF
jgi:hypothetical protein